VKKDGVTPSNSVIAFHDNSSALAAPHPVPSLAPAAPGRPSPFAVAPTLLHPILTAETHNFPCAVAPFPGAETGTGGRLRDVQATGRGAHTLAGVSAYCFGQL
jgi:phosphoribosylformylglycinamidine synthase